MLALAPTALPAKEMVDRDWLHARSANFDVFSSMSRKETIELLRELEMFRFTVSLISNIRRIDSPIPTRIYAFDDEGDVARLGLRAGVAGFFSAGLRDNTIVIRSSSGIRRTALILHEYVHYLVRNSGSLNYPLWFNEGLAEYLSSARAVKDLYQIGAVPEHRKAWLANLRWMPLARVISGDNYANWSGLKKGQFYAESWALVHFLLNRDYSGGSFAQSMAAHIELVEAGRDPEEAFEDAFGLSPERADRRVRQYLSIGRLPGLSLRIDKVLATFEADTVRLTREQAALELARLALRMNQLEDARELYSIAAADEDLRAWAEAGIGDTYKFDDDYDSALPHFDRAIMLAPEDVMCRLDMAEYWHDLAKDTDDASLKIKHLEQARETLRQSVAVGRLTT